LYFRVFPPNFTAEPQRLPGMWLPVTCMTLPEDDVTPADPVSSRRSSGRSSLRALSSALGTKRAKHGVRYCKQTPEGRF
jgi:hypothetical protein